MPDRKSPRKKPSPPGAVRLFVMARQILTLAGGLALVLLLSADWLGLDQTPGIGRTRLLEIYVAAAVLMIGLLLHWRPVLRELLRAYGGPMMTRMETVFVLFLRGFLAFAGVVLLVLSVFGYQLGIRASPEWGLARFLELIAAAVVCIVCLLAFHRPMFQWMASRKRYRALSAAHFHGTMLLIFAILVPGLLTSGLLILADWFELDPTPGWGPHRRLQFTISASLTAGAVLLLSRRLLVWESRHLNPRELPRFWVLMLLVLRTAGAVSALFFAALAFGWESLSGGGSGKTDPNALWALSATIAILTLLICSRTVVQFLRRMAGGNS